jgi:hypothetical protein
MSETPKTITLTDPPEADEIELRQRILAALDPILDEEEANDAATAAAAAVIRPPGLQDDIVDHELLAAHDEVARLRRRLDAAYRERDDARSAGLAYKRDRDRWKDVAAIHACATPGQDGWQCEHYRDPFNSQPDDLASPETCV